MNISIYIYKIAEEKKQINFFVKLQMKFNRMDAYSNNQKVLQLMFNTKDCVLPLAFGHDETTGVYIHIYI